MFGVEENAATRLHPVSSAANSNMLTILVVILLLIALGALPTWPYSRGWGYYPSSGLGLIVLILVILLLLGRI
jgi:membrane protein YdbS with pleckstrin-like domain